MKKKILRLCAAVILLAALFATPGLAAADTRTYELEDLELSIEIPNSYGVTAQGVVGNRAVFALLGVDPEEFWADYEGTDIYLSAVGIDPLREVNIATFEVEDVFTIDVDTLKNAPSYLIDQQIDYFLEDSEVTDCRTYENDQALYIVADLEQRQSDGYVHMYFTVIGGQGYNIGLYTYGQQAGFTQEQELEAMVDSIDYHNLPLGGFGYDSSYDTAYRAGETIGRITAITAIPGFLLSIAALVITLCMANKRKKQREYQRAQEMAALGQQEAEQPVVTWEAPQQAPEEPVEAAAAQPEKDEVDAGQESGGGILSSEGSQPAPEAEPRPAAKPRFCTECGKPLPENAAFCPECGKKVQK